MTALEEKRPFWCHCRDCGHEFAPFLLPILVEQMPTEFKCARGRGEKTYPGNIRKGEADGTDA